MTGIGTVPNFRCGDWLARLSWLVPALAAARSEGSGGTVGPGSTWSVRLGGTVGPGGTRSVGSGGTVGPGGTRSAVSGGTVGPGGTRSLVSGGSVGPGGTRFWTDPGVGWFGAGVLCSPSPILVPSLSIFAISLSSPSGLV